MAVVWRCREAGQACLLLCGAAGDEVGRDGCGGVVQSWEGNGIWIWRWVLLSGVRQVSVDIVCCGCYKEGISGREDVHKSTDYRGVLTPVVVAAVVRLTHPRGHRLQLFTQTVLPSWSASYHILLSDPLLHSDSFNLYSYLLYFSLYF